jgi:hypothetical protein
MRRRWRLTVADTGSRMERQQEYVPEQSPRDLISSDQHDYVDAVPGMQQKYAQNSVYNGSDALARLRGGDGG